MADSETISVYNNQVDNYARRFTGEKPDHALLSFVNEMPERAFVLDLGCGPGNAAAYMVSQGIRTDAVDASSEMVRFANEQHNLDARVATFDAIDATDLYDGIWANFSLLHAPRDALAGHLQQLHECLKENGLLHLGMKTGRGEKRDALGRFYTFYTQEELVRHLESVGFSISRIHTGEDAGLAGNVEPWITILARKAC